MPEPTSSPQVLRITRSDEPESFVLLRVSSSPSKALDLDIAATEGENPYTGSIRQSRLKNLRAKNYQGTDDEWTQIVSYVFGQLVTSNGELEWTSSVEASASISGSEDDEDNRELVITVRKRIQTITQRLGTITLKQDDDQAIELYDWAGIAITRADALEKQFSSLSHRCHLAEDTIQQLSRQLEELIGAKSQHEDQLIANFAQLLNEKKLKIRNQQRLLASATVDPEKVSAIQAATSNEGRDSTRKNRRPKRDAQEMNQEEPESEDGFETMEVDQDKNQDREAEQETDDEQPSTPEPLEDEGDGTTDDESAPSPVENGKKDGGAQKPSINRPPLKEPAAPPPRRELPFARAPEQKEMRHTEVDAESTDGETDDDEL